MLGPEHEAVLVRYVDAAAAYHALLRDLGDNSRLRLALIDRVIVLERQRRGDPPPPAPLWSTLEEAVDVELIRLRPRLRVEVALQRERRRLANGCGPVQLRASGDRASRAKLRGIVSEAQRSGLSIREIANVIGMCPRTLERHLAGDTISRQRKRWYQSVEAIDYVPGERRALISVRIVATRKRWGWLLSPGQRRAVFAGTADAAVLTLARQ